MSMLPVPSKKYDAENANENRRMIEMRIAKLIARIRQLESR